MSIAGKLLLGVTEALRGSQTLQVLRNIQSTPFLPRSLSLDKQWVSLSSLLATAETHVPYYREMFRTLGIRSDDIRNLNDYARLPVLTKDIVRDHLNELLREDIRKEDLIAGFSGGSTGVPVKFYRDRKDMYGRDAAAYRNLLQCGWKPGEMIAYFWGGNEELYAMSSWEFELRQYLRRKYQFDPFHSGTDDMDKWLRKWKRVGATVAFGYASTIARFAAHIVQTGAQVAPLRGVFTTAEKLHAPQRELISRVFGCRTYDCYGSSEVMNIASECSHGQMHINVDFVVLEAEDSTEAGASLIVTSLWNQVLPFLRYRNEDCGQLLEGYCNCGNQFPLMRLSISRISDNFILPDGRVVHGEFFTHLMYGSEGIASFQFHQTAPDAITLWVVPGPGPATARQAALRAAVEQIRRLDERGRIRVEVRETDSIPLSSTGKHRFTRSDVAPRGAGTKEPTLETR